MSIDGFRDELLRRFLRYVSVDTQSDPEKASGGLQPSTDSQRVFALTLASELAELGIDSTVDEHGYLLARIPASPGCDHVQPFGLSAHMDTSSETPGNGVKPRVHERWDGAPIILEGGHALDPATDGALARAIGQTLITSDGTTLLGADDKAGIAEIMTLASILSTNQSIKHGPIEILFSPDEETGHGMDNVPLAKLSSRFFYTVDGGEAGEVEAECFNAWRCDVSCTGVAAHLGTAKGRMVNAAVMAATFVASLPARESPETTEGREGYFCPLEIQGGVERASVTVFLRDFELASMESRIARVRSIAQAVGAQFPGGKIEVSFTQQYLNMRDKLAEAPEVLERLIDAARRAGVEPAWKPIRGGTDGSRLTEMGIPTPNIFTGGHNYHSRIEWASLDQMELTVKTLVELASMRETTDVRVSH